MTNSSIDLSGKIEKRIVDTILDVNAITRSIHVPFFLVGATARDIFFKHFSIEPPRRTRDIDLAVNVESIEKFQGLTKKMATSDKFKADSSLIYRFIHNASSVQVDVIPFGRIEDPPGCVRWQHQEGISLSTLGFKESFDASVTFRINREPEVDVKVATPAGLAIMKVIAWKETSGLKAKHAQDLLYLMKKYLDTGNIERLYEEDKNISNEKDFDYEKASARLLGRDIARIASEETLRKIIEILDEETNKESKYDLVNDMTVSRLDRETRFEENLDLLIHLKLGFLNI